MNIKFKEYEIVEGEKPNGETWKAYIIHGTKMDDGDSFKSSNVFDNKHNQKVINIIRTLETGDKVDVVHVKNGRFWNITDIIALNGNEPTAPPKNMRGKGTKSGTGKGGDSMSKEEWAEKNRVDRLSIAKSVALKAAVEAGKTTPKAAIKFADEIIPWLIDVEGGVAEPVDDGSDPLDPPA